MSKPIIKGANPFIAVGRTPLNMTTFYNEEDYDESISPLYQGFLSDRNLKISFLVLWNNHFELENQNGSPELKNYREFQIVKLDALYLHGIDKGKHTDYDEKSGLLSTNPEIVQILFSDVLNPYGIQLNKVNMHDYKDFESVDFVFADEALKNNFYDLVDYTFRKHLT